MKTAELLRRALIMHMKRWRSLHGLTQHQAAKRLEIGRTVIAQDYGATKLETLLELWDRVGGSIAFTIMEPREKKPDDLSHSAAGDPVPVLPASAE